MAFVSASITHLDPTPDDRGRYFPKKEYRDRAFVAWIEAEPRIMEAVLPDSTPLTQCYYHAWREAWQRTRRPLPDTGWVSNFFDPCPEEGPLDLEAVAFGTLLASLAGDPVPAARSLDNFYREQFSSGEIPAQLDRSTGREQESFRRRNMRQEPVDFAPFLLPQGQGAPILAWVEWEAYLQTGDQERLSLIHEALLRHYRFLHDQPRHATGLYPDGQGVCRVAWNSQLVLTARRLSEMCGVLAVQADLAANSEEGVRLRAEQRKLTTEADELRQAISAHLWDGEAQSFRDLGSPSDRATAFWALLAEVADSAQADALAGPLQGLDANWEQIGPVLFDGEPPAQTGPLVLVACHGLRRCGHGALAHHVALAYARLVAQVWRETGSFWSAYAADTVGPRDGAQPAFLLDAGIGAIRLVAEFCVGLRPNAPAQRLQWDVDTLEYCGHERYRFGGQSVSFRARGRAGFEDPLEIEVEADRPFHLVVRTGGRRKVIEIRGKASVSV